MVLRHRSFRRGLSAGRTGLLALLGTVMMLGLARTLPPTRSPVVSVRTIAATPDHSRNAALLWLDGAVMFVLAGFELGIVLQVRQEAGRSSHQAALSSPNAVLSCWASMLCFFSPLCWRRLQPVFLRALASFWQ